MLAFFSQETVLSVVQLNFSSNLCIFIRPVPLYCFITFYDGTAVARFDLYAKRNFYVYVAKPLSSYTSGWIFMS
jgi:hypothetical protein